MKFGDRTRKIKDCYNCLHCESDMDMNAYCYHPFIIENYPWGKYLYNGISHCLKKVN